MGIWTKLIEKFSKLQEFFAYSKTHYTFILIEFDKPLKSGDIYTQSLDVPIVVPVCLVDKGKDVVGKSEFIISKRYITAHIELNTEAPRFKEAVDFLKNNADFEPYVLNRKIKAIYIK